MLLMVHECFMEDKMKKACLLALLLVSFALSAGFNLDCYSFPNALMPLLIPTYVEDSDETCHPDVLYFPQGWNNWHYWMSHTPYPNSDVSFENPSIVVSNDGLNWVEPTGIVNPVADVYQGTDMNNNYNSDSHLMISPDGRTMHLIWRRKNGWNNELTQMKSSTDGINWSATTTLLSVLGTDPVLNESTLSACLLHNGSRYMLWTVNTKVEPRGIYMRYADALDASWSQPILTDIADFPKGYRVWHMDVEFIDGYYHMLAAVGIPTTQEGRDLYLGKSLDGVHWTFSSQAVMNGILGAWDARLYRPAFLRDSSGMAYQAWYGSMNHPRWRIGYSEAEISGYLAGPQNFYIDHNYDGQNHYSLFWDAPNAEITGYKVYSNHALVDSLDSEQNSYLLDVVDPAPYEHLAVFAVTALYGEAESDPVILRKDIALSNPSSPEIPTATFSISPNPFKDSFRVESKNKSGGSLKLYSCKGQSLGSWRVKNGAVIELPAQLSSGIYYAVFQSHDGQAQVKKVLRIK